MKKEMKLVIENTSKRFYQWDTGCRLIVLNADECNEVHYKSADHQQALVCKIYEENGIRFAEVPNVLLQSCDPFYAYLCSDSTENFRTLKSVHFNIYKRAKPEDYIYTETEVLSYSTLDERIHSLEMEQGSEDARISEGVKKYLHDNPITPENIGALSVDQLNEAIEKSLAQAKASGEFKGEKGDAGATGAAGVTPVKGVDYFDGEQGPKGDAGENGKDGKDGIPATHTWTGTTLTITSASGTSFADLKGDKGDKGDTGAQGIQGEKGEKGDIGPQGPKGDTGATGPQGPAGSNATVTKESIETALGYIPAGAGITSPLTGKKIIYDGDSICAASFGYPKLIADKTACIYENQAVGGARLCSYNGAHSVVDNLANLPKDGDLYCFEGGINDFWGNTPIGTYARGDYTGIVDPTTIYGAMESIFRYALTNFFGRAICFVITHKIKNTMYTANTEGKTFWDYREAMINVCEKYSIPYYDAFAESGLNGWHTGQATGLFIDGDGIHPTETAYEACYVPSLIKLFERIVPVGDYVAPEKPVTYTNVLKLAVDSSANPYNGGTGIKENYYLDGNAAEQSSTNYDITGFIRCVPGDVFRLKNVQLCKTVSGNSKCQIHYFKPDRTLAGKTSYLKTPTDLSEAWEVVTNDSGTDIVQFKLPTSLSSVGYIRLCCGTLTAASIITINELIE